MEQSIGYPIDRMYLEGQELEERLRDYLTRFIEGSLDPDLQGVSPDKFISNMAAGRFGDFAERYIITAGDDGKTVGILIGIPSVNGALHIYSVHVLPEYRGDGIGFAMLTRCVNDMCLCGVDSLLIDVHADNIPAYRLYKKFGFVENTEESVTEE